MTYRVIKGFYDLQDADHRYQVGDPFPRPGITVSGKRIEELVTGKNRRREPLIEAIDEKPAKKTRRKAKVE